MKDKKAKRTKESLFDMGKLEFFQKIMGGSAIDKPKVRLKIIFVYHVSKLH
jgi:hypothetical protein